MEVFEGTEDDGGESGLIDGVREMLGLEADGVVGLAGGRGDWFALVEVAFPGVELHAGLVGEDVHEAAALRFVCPGGEGE